MSLLRIGYNGLSGMLDSARRVHISSHNLANLQTNGFKAQQIRSGDVVVGHTGAGVTTLAILHDPSIGPVMPTEQWSDVAINGSGYFGVEDPSGKIYYTRNGSFSMDSNGFLVNAQGYRVMNAQGTAIPALPSDYNYFTVDEKGQIWGIDADGNAVNLGEDFQIGVAKFNNESGLIAQGGTLYLPSSQSGSPVMGPPGENGTGQLITGSIEGSNVKVEEELVGTITAKHTYTANARVIKTMAEMARTLFDVKG